jgi:hypothetical protein
MKSIKSKKAFALLAVLVVAVAAAIGAYAYWTSTGAGTGTAQTGNIPPSLHVTQTSDTGPSFTPGGTGQVLGGTIESVVLSGGSNVVVTKLVATLAAPTGGSAGPNPCTTGDYEFTAGNGWTVTSGASPNDTATHTYSNINLAPGASTPWAGLQVDMVNRTDGGTPGAGNQDSCKTAVLNFNYSAS